MFGMMSEYERKRLGASLEAAFTTAGTLEPETKAKDQKKPKPTRQSVFQADGSVDYRAAAALKMFGKWTREEADWKPERLLCKRFGVADPFGPKTGRVFHVQHTGGTQASRALSHRILINLCFVGFCIPGTLQGDDGFYRSGP